MGTTTPTLTPTSNQPTHSGILKLKSKPRPIDSLITPNPLQPLRTQHTNPLNTNKPTPASRTDPDRMPQAYKPKTFKSPTVVRPPHSAASNKPKSLVIPSDALNVSRPDIDQCFDFPQYPSCDDFPRISMPPSMARRRQAERMSVVFSGISDAGVLALCVRVSRAWRYAGTQLLLFLFLYDMELMGMRGKYTYLLHIH